MKSHPKSFAFPGEFLKKISLFYSTVKSLVAPGSLRQWQQPLALRLDKLLASGFTAGMDEYEKRKLGIFNQLNLFQLVTGIIVPITVIFNSERFSLVSRLL